MRKNKKKFSLMSLAIAIILLPSQVMAAESVPYSPGHCEFTIAFPETPEINRRCENGDKDRCYDQVVYTQVYDLATTVRFRVICNPAGSDLFGQYSGKVMEATLKAMTERNVIKTFSTTFREEDNYKQAGLVGEGKVGVMPTIYIAQLWIGHKSILSVEAELIGEASEKADTLFGAVLKSIRFVDDSEKTQDSTKEEEEEEKENTAEEQAEKPKEN